MAAVKQGASIGEKDLPIMFDNQGMATDPYSIVFDFMDCTSGSPLLIGNPSRIPVKFGVGKFHPALTITEDEPLGKHKIAWKYKESPNDTEKTIEREFDVIPGDAVTGAVYPQRIQELIYELRKKLRDINPGRDYSFAPPSSEGAINGFNECRGYRWPDEQLANHIAQAANYINLFAPITCFDVCEWPCILENLLLKQAAVYAFYDLASMWIHEEFDYSLNGISMNISRSDKYLNIAQMFQQQVDKQLENSKSAMQLTMKGLRQSPYTFSRGAALGPLTSGLNLNRFVR